MGATLSHKTRSRGRRTGGTYRPMSEINVTPFVDVMLVLLIVFMVAAPLLTAGVNVDLPKTKAKALQEEDNKPITVVLNRDGSIEIGASPIEDKRLKPQLEAMLENNKDGRIYIRADKALDYGRVMQIIGRINAAGFTKVALISDPEN